jgi:hypothetical protein
MVELLELRQDDFVTVPIDGEDLHRTPDDNVGAVAGFAFPEDERRGGELDDLATSASSRSSAASRSLNRGRRWRNCSRSGAIIIRSEYRKHSDRALRPTERDVAQRLAVPQTTKRQRDAASK